MAAMAINGVASENRSPAISSWRSAFGSSQQQWRKPGQRGESWRSYSLAAGGSERGVAAAMYRRHQPASQLAMAANGENRPGLAIINNGVTIMQRNSWLAAWRGMASAMALRNSW